jgi:hypothetical protein
VWLWGETRKQGPGIAMANRRLLVGCKTFIGVQFGGEVCGDVSWCKGEVGAEKDVAVFCESLETWQRRRTRLQRCVEIETLEARQNVGRLRCIGPEDARELGEAMGGKWHEAAGMGEDDAGSRMGFDISVSNALLDEVASAGEADLSLVEEGSPGTRAGCGLDICIVQHDVGIVAPGVRGRCA